MHKQIIKNNDGTPLQIINSPGLLDGKLAINDWILKMKTDLNEVMIDFVVLALNLHDENIND